MDRWMKKLALYTRFFVNTFSIGLINYIQDLFQFQLYEYENDGNFFLWKNKGRVINSVLQSLEFFLLVSGVKN